MAYYKRRRRQAGNTQKIQKARIIHSDEYMGYLVFTPFILDETERKTFLDELKFIPDKPIRWDSELKAWIIFAEDLEAVKELVHRYFGAFDFMGPQESNEQFGSITASASESDFKTLFKIAGADLSNKFYRMIAANVHPREEGDDHRLSAELNAAWNNIKKSGIWS